MWVKAGGVPVWAEQFGQDHPGRSDVLLLHGWGCRIQTFSTLIKALQKDFRVTAIDFPGHGKTPEPPEPWSVTEYADMTAGVIREMNIAPCAVVAHSFGGRVSLLLGSRYPELIGKILITGGAGLPPKPTLKRRLRALLYAAANMLPLSAAFRERMAARFGSTDYKALGERMKKTFVRVINQDLTPALPDVRPPTLLVWGENDAETPLWMGQTMEKRIPGAALVVFEGAGHYAFVEQPDRFLRAALTFLEGESV